MLEPEAGDFSLETAVIQCPHTIEHDQAAIFIALVKNMPQGGAQRSKSCAHRDKDQIAALVLLNWETTPDNFFQSYMLGNMRIEERSGHVDRLAPLDQKLELGILGC